MQNELKDMKSKHHQTERLAYMEDRNNTAASKRAAKEAAAEDKRRAKEDALRRKQMEKQAKAEEAYLRDQERRAKKSASAASSQKAKGNLTKEEKLKIKAMRRWEKKGYAVEKSAILAQGLESRKQDSLNAKEHKDAHKNNKKKYNLLGKLTKYFCSFIDFIK